MEPLTNLNSPQTELLISLAHETVISNAHLLIKGAPGTGKTHFGKLLERKHFKSLEPNYVPGRRKELEFTRNIFRYSCLSGTDNRSLFIDLIEKISPEEKVASGRLPRLVAQFVEVLKKSGAEALYIDNSHRLSQENLENIQEAIQQVREDRRFGVIMTETAAEQLEMEELIVRPRCLSTVILEPLRGLYHMNALASYEPRLERWVEGVEEYEQLDPMAQKIEKRLMKATFGIFERVVSVCKSLTAHIRSESDVSLDRINSVLTINRGQ